MDNATMTCRACGRKLIILDRRSYETLAEHVTNPNREPSTKDGWGCPLAGCEDADLRYLEDGEGPYDIGPLRALERVGEGG